MLDIHIKLDNNTPFPSYATTGSAGVDLTANIPAPFTLAAGEKTLVPTGTAVQIPAGYAGFLYARSGLAVKFGIALTNGVGVIDSDYTGEIKVGLINLSNMHYTITPGERIAQLVFQPVAQANFSVVSELDKTGRGGGGFGSTGKL